MVQTVGTGMASVRIREAKEGDCGDILRLIRVKAAGRKPGCQGGMGRGLSRDCGWGRGRGAPGLCSSPRLGLSVLGTC